MLPLTETSWIGAKHEVVELPNYGSALRVIDDFPYGFATLQSAQILPVDIRLGYELSFLWSGHDLVNAHAKASVCAVNAKGEVLGEFSTGDLLGIEWYDASVKIAAKSWPAGTTGAIIRLYAKTDYAATLGIAYFRAIEFAPLEASPIPLPKLPGENLTADSYFKYSSLELSSRLLQKGPFAKKKSVPTLEVSWFGEKRLSSLQLLTNLPELGDATIAAWDDPAQSFTDAIPVPVQKTDTSQVIDLAALPATSKVLVTWPSCPGALEIMKAEIRAQEFPCPEWHASWIWYSRERKDYVNGCFRYTFKLDKLPVEAHIQHRASHDYEHLKLNGVSLAGVRLPETDIASSFRLGKNRLTAKILQKRYFGGLLVEIDLKFADGTWKKILTNDTWKAYEGDAPAGWTNANYDDSSWENAVDNGRPGMTVSDDTPVMQCMGASDYVNFVPLSTLKLQSHHLPQELAAGKLYQLEWNLELDKPGQNPSTPVVANFMRGSEIFFRWNLGNIDGNAVRQRLTAEIHLNDFLPPGEYRILFQTPGFRILDNDSAYAPVVHIANRRHPRPAQTELRMHNGAQTIFVNDEPQLFTATAQDFAVSTVECSRRFGCKGINVYSIYPIMKLAENGDVDFSSIDNYAVRALEGNPDAKLIVRIQMRPSVPLWFIRENPDELVRYDAGGGRPLPSLASLKWREVAGDAIRKSIAHIRTSPYADKVIGYSIYEGEEGQWMNYWGGPDPTKPDSMGDYSPAMRTAFRQWLAAKYADDAALQAAWRRGGATLATAEIPTRQERIAGKGAFRNPDLSRPAMDFAECLSDTVADGINYYGRIVKEATEGHSLNGVLYGHIIDLAAFWIGENVGYLKLRRVVESPYVDFVIGPHYYFEPFRNEGGIGSFDFPGPISLMMHGKLWINEDDMRTHLRYPHEYEYTMHSVAQCRENTGRHFAMTLCGGAGNYFYDLTANRNWFDDPELMETFGGLAEIAREALSHDRTPAAEIALVFDDRSCINYRSVPPWNVCPNDMAMQMTIFNREQLGRIGAPFDLVLLDDAVSPDAPKYKLYVFANTCRMSAMRRREVHRILQRNNATALWIHAPALFDDADRMDVSHVAEMIGGKCVLDNTPRSCDLIYRDGSIWGGASTIAPVLLPTEADEVLARFADGMPAFVRNGRHFFVSTPTLSREGYRHVAQAAGVELFTDSTDAIYHCKDYLAIHTTQRPGERLLRAPAGKHLRQIWPRNERLGETGDCYRFFSQAPTTLIFAVED